MQEQQNDLFGSINIDLQGKQTLASIASWAMICVVTAVIGYVLTVIGLFTKPTTVTVRSEGFSSYLKMGGDDMVATVISIAIGLLMNYFLYRFATMLKTSLPANSEEQLSGSFRNLRYYFIVWTILLILILLIVLIAFAAVL